MRDVASWFLRILAFKGGSITRLEAGLLVAKFDLLKRFSLPEATPSVTPSRPPRSSLNLPANLPTCRPSFSWNT
ncbi:hypothetical protein E2C01_092648 [Portunus trituberculatus]|uniref:Uncharacterized protein n=1 Tax=Portunus trituberculatus TaxID=210409 RepID=A0A5B7JSR1_PORTR|nr:hypothetical protein [Portunus trituberculatus]